MQPQGTPAAPPAEMSPYLKTPFLSRRSQWILETLLVVAICFSIHFLVSTSSFGKISTEKQGLRIDDYVYKLHIIKDFWSGEIPSIYRFENQIQTMEKIYGIPLAEAMPIGDTPTVVLVFLPFSLLAMIDFPLTMTLWVSLSLIVLFHALGRARESIPDAGILPSAT